MRHRAKTRPQVWTVIAGVIALVLVCAAVVYSFNRHSVEQRQIQAAEQLVTQQAEPSTLPTVTPSPAATPTGVPSVSRAAPKPASEPVDISPVLPVTKFTWPAVGLSVDVVPMDWRADQTINPPLDANGFDPVAHWLKGSGESKAARPIILAAHTCIVGNELCNDVTFPFNKLSHDGWAVGQPASLVDAIGQTINYTLADRRIVDKAKAFEFANDRCLLAVFTCNLADPHGKITLVTYKRNGCGT